MLEEEWEISSMPNGEIVAIGNNVANEYVIIESAFKHWQDEDCPIKLPNTEEGKDDWARVLANMAETAYYGIVKEEGSEYYGDKLGYTRTYNGIESEIGIQNGW